MARVKPLLEVGDQRQLLLDERFLASSGGVQRVVNRPRLDGPALEPGPEGSWDDGFLLWGTVAEEDGLCRMWVNGRPAKVLAKKKKFGAGEGRLLPLGHATSIDGIHWEKPRLGLLEWNGSSENNLVCMDFGTVFRDPQAAPSQRYKLLVSGHHALGCKTVLDDLKPEFGGLYFYTSADGIRWTWSPDRVLPLAPDTFNQMIYDSRLKKYVAYVRVWPGGFLRGRCYGRAIGRIEMDDPLTPWPFTKLADPFHPWGRERIATVSREIPLAMAYPGYDQPGHWTDIYEPEVVQYPWAEDAYFAFPALNHFLPDSAIPNHSRLEVGMCVSRDGISWTWPSLEPYIPFGPKGSGRSGMLFSLIGMIRRGDEIYQYHAGTDIEHGSMGGKVYGYEKLLNSGRIYRTVQRLDGFVSLDFASGGGALVTPAIRFRGQQLRLNVNATAGSGKVEMCDESGRPLPGFTLADCDPITRDCTHYLVTWKGNPIVGRFAGRRVRLRFCMHATKLYAFQFA